jgi:hypothetical protein
MSQKTIQLNPEFLSLSSRKRDKTRKKREKKQKQSLDIKPNKLRKQLLARIKDHQKKAEETVATPLEPAEEEFQSEFNKSLSFLHELSKKKKNKKELRKSRRRKKTSGDVATELPKEMVVMDISAASETAKAPVESGPKEEPPYSTIKHGSKPTFREWQRLTQKKTDEAKKPLAIVIADAPMVIEKSDREIAMEKVKVQYKDDNPSRRPAIQKKIKTVKYHLGRTGHKVAVLIKDRKTRKQVQYEHALLKQKSIIEVKNYLRRRNLLKTGSDAPIDVLRQMYEQAILTGEVNNQGKETLIHNFINT